jgi:ABC-2 type transport system permease protein
MGLVREKMNDLSLTTTAPPITPSPLRAWCYLVWLSWQRQLRTREMVWIALALLTFAALFVGFNTLVGRWDIHNRQYSVLVQVPNRNGPTYRQWADSTQILLWSTPRAPGFYPLDQGILSGVQLIMNHFSMQMQIFVRGIVFTIFLNFLLPLWSMSFATEALGGDRESNSLLWLLTRPLPRPAIYLGKFTAMLPWSLALNLGGFGLLCLLGGPPGHEAFKLLWPSVLCGALAFSSLFFLFGAFFRRPAIVAILYTFFLEAILGNMPGYLKRVSINFYTQCMMFDALKQHGIEPARPQIFLPVEGVMACAILLGTALGLLMLGMIWFGRKEYHEIS